MAVAVLLSVVIGVALGLLGGGGSILTVPILVLAMGLDEKTAIATSLVVVGVTSAVAAIQSARAGDVSWRVALTFAPAGMAGAYAGARLAVLIPGSVLLVLFALVMAAAALAMWRGRGRLAPAAGTPFPYAKISLEGAAVGVLTGLVGAGGGFLIVPALVLWGGLDMRRAVGTSLVVIALKSAAGFAGYAAHVQIDHGLAAVVTAAAVMGSLAGTSLRGRIPAESLRRGFAVFVAGMAAVLLTQQAV